MTPPQRETPARSEAGAAAVEFALVSLIFFPILFGIIQFGLFFSDSIGARQGVREGARSGVVLTFPACGTATTDVTRLACNTRAQIGAISGPAYVRIATPDGWAKGKALVVCGMVQASAALGLVPMPNGGLIMTRTQMSIENTTAVPSGTFPYADTPPSGADWSWCT